MTIHLRSFDVELTKGRTLEGIAFYYETPSRVSDGGPSYLEEFARSSADKTITERPIVPLLRNHDLGRDPIGVATFLRSDEGLVFQAPLSKTRDADEALELINDGAMRSVSVRFQSYKNGRRVTAEGPVTVRTEIGLRELSICPTGFGQHEGAEIVSVRSEGLEDEGTPRLDAVRRRLILLAPIVTV